MTRTIKFRGKRLTDGEWIYGDFFRNRGKSFIASDGVVDNPLASWKDYNVQPDTVGQFTGLYDSNGKEIYEGDIIQFKSLNNEIDRKPVEYELSEFRPLFFTSYFNGVDGVNIEDTEIVGNIYDNPNLLTPQENEQQNG